MSVPILLRRGLRSIWQSRESENEKKNTANLKQQIDELSNTLAGARSAIRFISQAIESQQSGRFAEAIQLYDQALALDAKNAWALNLKSYSQFRANDFDGAVASVLAALELAPEYIEGYSRLSQYQCAAGNFDGAVETLRRALRRNIFRIDV